MIPHVLTALFRANGRIALQELLVPQYDRAEKASFIS
jgi:hypothetical protein